MLTVHRLAWIAAVIPALASGCGDRHSQRGVPAPTPTASVQPASPTSTVTATPTGSLGWAVGPRGGGGSVIVRSDDGARTWTVELTTTVDTSLDAITFVDAATGWVVGVDTILHTDDGGASWQPQQDALPPAARMAPPDFALTHYFAAAFVDAAHGVVAGGGPFHPVEFGGPSQIVVTDDGGRTWALAPIDGTNPALLNSPISSVCFTAAGIGVASGFGVSGSVTLVSHDIGHTWTEISAAVGACAGHAACAGEHDLWLAGGDSAPGIICHSQDSGATWIDESRNIPSPSGEIPDLVFVDDRNGWAASFDAVPRAVALRTTDGGGSWHSQVLPLVPDAVFMTPQAVAATSSTHAVVVGSASNAQGLLGPMALVTFDGGVTWQPSAVPGDVFFLKDVALE